MKEKLHNLATDMIKATRGSMQDKLKEMLNNFELENNNLPDDEYHSKFDNEIIYFINNYIKSNNSGYFKTVSTIATIIFSLGIVLAVLFYIILY